ncbi:MAG: hypothetical protein ABL977_10140 [Candidatus Eisenbacteria bacterium]
MSEPKKRPGTATPSEFPPPRIKRAGLGGPPTNPIPPKVGPRVGPPVGPHAPSK